MRIGFGNRFKKLLVGIIVLALVVGTGLPAFAGDNPEVPAFSGGEGTRDKPYLIAGPEDLIALSDAYLSESTNRDAHFKLTKDIDLGETVWQPIGSPKMSFSGVFDGNGRKIRIAKMADGHTLGLFGFTDSRSTIKNLVVIGAINQKIVTVEDVRFGLVAGMAEGTLDNCRTEGSVVLTVDTPKELDFGGVIGFGRGAFAKLSNNASLKLTRSGSGYTALGGIIGSSRGNTMALSQTTNTGKVSASTDGRILAGGIAGEYGSGPAVYNALNAGDISIACKKADDNARIAAGGITGEIRESDLDRILNRGKVYAAYTGANHRVESIAGGITGLASYGQLKNAGNEGSVEVSGPLVVHAAGIAGICDKEVKIANAYNKGKIYGSSPSRDGELYIAGLIDGEAVVDNFYNSGSAKLKAGSMREIDGFAFANIKPDYNTKTFNYSYWTSVSMAFPLLQKGLPTTSKFNAGNGTLSRSVKISGKPYGNVTDALNAWVASRQKEYVKWSGKNTPVFVENFGCPVQKQASVN